VQFVLVAPEAASVSLVGDFNDWDVSATPLMRGGGDGVWAVTIPLNPGRYRYSFLVDGTTWQRDPQAARTVEDEFGRPNSVLTIGGA
jgi:1,4-alpha-glucan branching enzyme